MRNGNIVISSFTKTIHYAFQYISIWANHPCFYHICTIIYTLLFVLSTYWTISFFSIHSHFFCTFVLYWNQSSFLPSFLGASRRGNWIKNKTDEMISKEGETREYFRDLYWNNSNMAKVTLECSCATPKPRNEQKVWRTDFIFEQVSEKQV